MAARGWRRAAIVLALVSLVAVAACEPEPEGDTSSPNTTVAPGPSSTTTSSTTSTSTSTTSTSTTTTSTTTTTTIPDPGPGGGSLTLQDTGLTRVRVTLTSQASWVTVDLLGTNMDLIEVRSTSGNLQLSGLGGTHIGANGTGSAVIDFVLAVPPGANTSLQMCKNYQGPASVTVERITYGTAVVGEIQNTGTSTDVPWGSCENFRTGVMTRANLIGPKRWPARRDPRPLVLANYYPWYDQAALGTSFGDQPIGPADTSDPVKVAQAVALAAASGIDGFVVEYEATTAFNAWIDHVWNAADARGDFQMATMLDFAILQYRTGLEADGLDAILAEMARHANRPSQLEVGGQPVVFLYSSWLVDQSQWSAALTRLQTRTGLRPFVIDDSDAMPGPGQYSYGSNNMTDEPGLQRWAKDRLMTLQERPGLYGQAGPLWVAPVSPGYDDRRLNRYPALYVDRNNGVRYEQSWNAALASLPDWILVSTWNEYYEQTHVMPGSTTGYRALDQTRARSAVFHTTG